MAAAMRMMLEGLGPVTCMVLENNSALGWYERLGFEKVELLDRDGVAYWKMKRPRS